MSNRSPAIPTSYRVTIPGLAEPVAIDLLCREDECRTMLQSRIRELMQEHKIFTERRNPQPVMVRYCQLTLEKGAVKDGPPWTIKVQPPIPRMTSEDFSIESQEVLADVPWIFRGTLHSIAYERGHSAGYE